MCKLFTKLCIGLQNNCVPAQQQTIRDLAELVKTYNNDLKCGEGSFPCYFVDLTRKACHNQKLL
jgi:hypothetical protein